MDAAAFEKISDFIDENKDKMTDGDYMAMMGGLKSLHDKKLVGATAPPGGWAAARAALTTAAPPANGQYLWSNANGQVVVVSRGLNHGLLINTPAAIPPAGQMMPPPPTAAAFPPPTHSPRRCGICRATTHDRRRCPNRPPPAVPAQHQAQHQQAVQQAQAALTAAAAAAQPAAAQPEFIYHYTDKAGFDAITRQEKLNAGYGVLAAPAVYFTSISPNVGKRNDIIRNNWAVSTPHLINRRIPSMEFVIGMAANAPALQGLERVDRPPDDVYAIQGDVMLDCLPWTGYRLKWRDDGVVSLVERLAWRD